MRRRRTRRRNGRSALFEFTPDGDIQEASNDNPLIRRCDPELGGCGAQPHRPCTRPGRGGRVPLRGYHPARTRKEPPS